MSDDINSAELEELRRNTERGSRVEDDAKEDERSFADVAFEELSAGPPSNPTVAFRDQDYFAFLAALFRDESIERREEVKQNLCDRLGISTEKIGALDRSEAVRLAMRVGFNEAAPELMEQFDDARMKHAQENIY